jgi:hypothetical protein
MKRFLFVVLFFALASTELHAQTDDLELYCAKITAEKDKINGRMTYKSPITNDIVFTRFNRKGEKYYMMHLKKTTKIKDSGYGVTILFENGKRMYKHLKISIRITDETEFEHFIHLRLDEQDVEMLKTNLITDVILYQLSFPVQQPEKYQAYLKCIDRIADNEGGNASKAR